jgi:hypothetical protein
MKSSSWQNIFSNCKQATFFLVKKSGNKLPLTVTIKLFLHLLFCNPCRQFKKQSDLIDHLLKKHNTSMHIPAGNQLSTEKKQKFKQLLSNQQ